SIGQRITTTLQKTEECGMELTRDRGQSHVSRLDRAIRCGKIAAQPGNSAPPHRPWRAIYAGSVPETWVTFHSEDIGNTLGPKGLARGSSLQVSVAEIVVYEAYKPTPSGRAHGSALRFPFLSATQRKCWVAVGVQTLAPHLDPVD